MATSEIIQPSYILPNELDERSPVLGYSPSLKCCLFNSGPDVLSFLNIDSGLIVKKLVTRDNLGFSTKVALSSDSSLLAVNVPHEFINLSNTIPAQIRVFCVTKGCSGSNDDAPQSSVYITPGFGNDAITNLKFFPDGSRIIATTSNFKRGPWCKIFTFPEGLWDEDESVDHCDRKNVSENRNNRTLACEEIDVFQQGFPIPDDRAERMNNAETDEEYFELYNQMYYASNIDGGLFCLAISPDTTRVLAGSNDGEVYIMEPSSQKVLQCVRAYEYYKTVSGCHYNPVFAHQEFATCGESGFLDIWRVEELDDGTEEAGSVHRLKFEPGTCCCTYSPDGELIALTSAAVFKTYIICSHSGETMYTLVYQEEFINYESYFTNSSLFIGHLCQVATVHSDSSLCFWKLPVVYSLITLCLLVIRAAMKYNHVENLPLSTPLKLQLKYLYV